MSNVNSRPQYESSIKLKKIILGIYLAVLLILALFPPLYLSVSGSHGLVLGVPIPIAYWIMIACLLGIGMWVLYLVERNLGEIPDDEVQP